MLSVMSVRKETLLSVMRRAFAVIIFIGLGIIHLLLFIKHMYDIFTHDIFIQHMFVPISKNNCTVAQEGVRPQ